MPAIAAQKLKQNGRKRKLAAVNGTELEDDLEVTFRVPKAKKARKMVAVAAAEEEPEPAPRRSPNGYILPDPLPSGLVLTDLRKNSWKLGKSVGLGGFGEIYSAAYLNGESRK
jgi:hypothetical protein